MAAQQESHHDYVIVGAGTAGCVLAARLSERDGARVLLLEAGGPATLDLLAVPQAWPALMRTEVDWCYATVPQAGTAHREHIMPLGRVLGGSSAINAMAHIRGHRANFDRWAREGATGWEYDSVLPYFKRSEHAEGRHPAYRGVGGPLRVAPAHHRHPLSRALFNAALEVGIPATEDSNGEQPEGVCWHELNIVDGARQSAATAYLEPSSRRPGLTIETGALALRVLLDGDRCVGVEYAVDGHTRRARAAEEVVLAAGAVGSPKLLMLSGLGPEWHLRELGIDVVEDLPGVGANLHDHPLAGITYEARRPVEPGANQHGEVSALQRTGRDGQDMDEPDLQFVFIDVPFHPPDLQGPANGYTIGFAVMTPVSRGTLRLAGPDPAQAPRIDPGYLAEPQDVRRMLVGFQRAREIGAASALAEWRDRQVLPEPEVIDGAAARDYLARCTGTYFHLVGTCAIGRVVDPQLRVHGIDGLRVADASVMPSIVSANTNATTVMIGERAAALIAGHQGYQR
ncbi:GMC family oxidoreductase N-terminal domain-containing protein [Streptomyces sp. NPDC002994]|uniref:GMC family oxidoreductase n=1 Tax=Streptomyces sp. NPDC002994 TaxID=3154441 RepID=UPI0033BF57C6